MYAFLIHRFSHPLLHSMRYMPRVLRRSPSDAEAEAVKHKMP